METMKSRVPTKDGNIIRMKEVGEVASFSCPAAGRCFVAAVVAVSRLAPSGLGGEAHTEAEVHAVVLGRKAETS